MKLNELLDTLMLEKAVTPDDVARDTGISRTTIYNIKNGYTKKPSFDTLRNLAKYFGVDVKTLIPPKENEDDFSARVAAEVQKQLKAAGPSLNKIVLNPYQKEIIDKKYFKGNGFLTVYTRMKQMTPEAREVLYRLLWGIDEVLRRENYRNDGAGEA